MIETKDLLFLGLWSLLGSALGFFSFVFDLRKSFKENIGRCCLSIGVGLFISIPIYVYLTEMEKFSKLFSIMLSGIGAFGLPDFIINYWDKLIHKVADKYLDNTLDKK